MHHLPIFLRFLRSLPSLPLSLRLSIFLLSFIICGAFMILGLLVTNNRGLTPIFLSLWDSCSSHCRVCYRRVALCVACHRNGQTTLLASRTTNDESL